MRFTSRTLLAGAALMAGGAQAALLTCPEIALVITTPYCGRTCIFESGIPTIGCASNDYLCMCENRAGLMAAIEGCVATTCEESEYPRVIEGIDKLCECFDPAAPSVTASGTVVPGPSGTVVPPPSDTVVPPSPSASFTDTVVPAPPPPPPPVTTVTTTSPKPAPTAEPTTAAPPVVTGAANRAAGAGLGLLGGVAAAIALL